MSEGDLTIYPDATGVRDESLGSFIRDIIDPDEGSGSPPDLAASAPPIAALPIASARATAWPGLELSAYRDLAAVEAEWRAFATTADRTVFQSFDWLTVWQHHVGARRGVVPAIVVGRDDGGSTVMILQLAVETRGGIRRLTWLGADLCDYNAPLLAPGFADGASQARFSRLWRDVLNLLRTRLRFDLVDLQKMPATLGGRKNPLLDLDVLPHPSHAHLATLGSDWEAFYASKRSASTRKRERRQRKQLAELGAIRLVEVREPADIARSLDLLMAQKGRTLARMGVEDIFARPGYRQFFHAVASDPRLRDMVHVTRLDVGSTAAAVGVGLAFRDRYSLVLSSYRDGDMSRLGPGRTHLHELLRQAIDNGFRVFDFTVGDEPYKRDWSDIELEIFDYLVPVTIKGRVAVAMATGLAVPSG